MSKPGSRPTGAARAKAPKVELSADHAPSPAPEAAAAPAFAWPPTEADLESFEPLEIVDPLDVSLPPPLPMEPDRLFEAEPDQDAVEARGATPPTPRQALASRPVLAALAAGAALVGASVAWLTRPVDVSPRAPSTASSVASPVAPAPDVSATASAGIATAPAVTAITPSTPRSAREPAPSAPVPSAGTSAPDDAALVSRAPASVAPEAGGLSAVSSTREPAPASSPAERVGETAVAAPLAPPISLPLPATSLPSAPLSTAGSPVTPRSSSFAPERTAIQQLLVQYAHAYDALDAGAASAIWPSVDAGSLERAFAGIKQQSLLFDRCELDVAVTQATAVCPGSLTFVRRVGDTTPKVLRASWTFAFERAPDGWQIARVAAR